MKNHIKPDILSQYDVRIRTKTPIPIRQGECVSDFYSFDGLPDGKEHFAIGMRGLTAGETPLVRIHSECITGDLFGSVYCDCGEQLNEAITEISKCGGYLVYLRQEGRGIGLFAKLEAYALQRQGLDTFEANRQLAFPDDLRSYLPAALILHAIGVTEICLMTNNPEKMHQIQELGITVASRRATGTFQNAHNLNYLRAKALKSNHEFFDLPMEG